MYDLQMYSVKGLKSGTIVTIGNSSEPAEVIFSTDLPLKGSYPDPFVDVWLHIVIKEINGQRLFSFRILTIIDILFTVAKYPFWNVGGLVPKKSTYVIIYIIINYNGI